MKKQFVSKYNGNDYDNDKDAELWSCFIDNDWH